MSFLEPGEPTARAGADRPLRAPAYDLVCLSHLRWDFVYQRPQHLLSRCARARRVFFVEEPITGGGPPRLDWSRRECGVTVVVPHLPRDLDESTTEALLRRLLGDLFQAHALGSYVLWYYTPMALGFTRHLRPLARVYDCMDELANFLAAPPALVGRERELLREADLVFTGGRSLHEAKRELRPTVHLFPSSIDAGHFAGARERQADPPDQAGLRRPRLGWFGVIDERLDLDLLAGVAELRPDWDIVMLGPVVKICPSSLPRAANIHWLGAKRYAELPGYIAGWDVAIMPFARNASTRYISPTKTPEYLAAGRPVVATSIRDVVDPYGVHGLVAIADTPEAFVAAVVRELRRPRAAWLDQVDAFLARDSWDQTWSRMAALIDSAVQINAAGTTREARPCSIT